MEVGQKVELLVPICDDNIDLTGEITSINLVSPWPLIVKGTLTGVTGAYQLSEVKLLETPERFTPEERKAIQTAIETLGKMLKA